MSLHMFKLHISYSNIASCLIQCCVAEKIEPNVGPESRSRNGSVEVCVTLAQSIKVLKIDCHKLHCSTVP